MKNSAKGLRELSLTQARPTNHVKRLSSTNTILTASLHRKEIVFMWKLNSNLKAMSIVAGILILLGGTVVGIYHCAKMLGWVAIFPAAGFLFADYLGFHLIFFARAERGLLGWGALICKFAIFGTLLLNGASLVYLLITDAKDKAAAASRIEIKNAELDAETQAKLKLIEAESNARKSEEAQRAENAARLKAANVSTRLAVAAIAEKKEAPMLPGVFPAPSASPIARETPLEPPGIVERAARWYTRAPLYFSGGMVGLLCFVLIQVFGKLDENRNGIPDFLERDRGRKPAQSAPISMPAPSSLAAVTIRPPMRRTTTDDFDDGKSLPSPAQK